MISISLKEKILLSFKKHNFYYRILLPFSIFSITLVCLMSGINWYRIENEFNKKIIESNQQFLKRASQLSDQYLYGNFTSILNSSFLDGFKTSKMDRFITYGDRLKPSEFLNLHQSITNICVQNSSVIQVSLYQYASDLYLDSFEGLVYNASKRPLNSDQSLKNYLSTISGHEKGILYYASGPNSFPAKQIVMLRSVPLYTSFTNGSGFIAITLDTNSLWEQLNMSTTSKNDSFFILDSEKKLLLEKSPSSISYEYLKSVSDSAEIPAFLTYNDIRYRLDEIVSEDSGWHYISCVPINILNAEVRTQHQLTLMITLICILLSLVIVQRISSKAYQPIVNLRNRLAKNYSSIESKDDLSIIEGTFSFLENQVDDIQKMLHKNSQVILYKLFMDILNKKELSDSQLLHKLELCGIHITQSNYCLLLIEFDKHVFYNLSLEQREYLITKSDSLLKDFLNEPIIQSAEAQPDNRIAVLLNLNPDNYLSLTEQLELLPDHLFDIFHIKINLAFSAPVLYLSEISKVYSQISEYMKYFFLLGYGNIFTDELIHKLDNTSFSFSLQDYQQIERMVRNGTPDEFSSLMESYQQIIESGGCSYQEANNFLIQTYRIAFNIGKELGLFNDPQKKEQILHDFNYAVDFAHSIECICLVVQMCHEFLNEEVLNADSYFIQQILEYIKTHQKEELSLSLVAQVFHVSTGHLSRLFKSVTNQNFSAYVINIKLETAAELLNNEPEKSISNIAAELGYYTPAYFTRLFKEKFGVTPSQFRKK